MVRAALVVALVAAAFPFLANPATAAGCARSTAPCRPATLQVPGQFRTIQAAVDAASTGDTIAIAAGTYDQPFVVSGKRLDIVGAGVGRVLLTSSDPSVGIATYTDGGGGELSGMSLEGGAYGIGSGSDVRSTPSALVVRTVTVSGGYRGIFGSFSSLALLGVTVHDTRWNGISLVSVLKLALSFDVEVYNAGGDGLFVSNVGAGDMLISGDFHNNALAGIYVKGNNGTVHMIFVTADHNGIGIVADGATLGIALSSLADNYQSDGQGGCTGAGLIAAYASFVTVSGTIFRDNCLSVAVGGSTLGIADNRFTLTTADPTAEETLSASAVNGVPGIITNNGGNVCGDNLLTPSQLVIPCLNWVNTGLQPPQLQVGLE
jgi:hypothetical protein